MRVVINNNNNISSHLIMIIREMRNINSFM